MTLIAIEEHFLWDGVAATFPDVDRALTAPSRVPNLGEIGEIRLRAMDEAGIDLQVISLNKPGVQLIEDPQTAAELARASNDLLAQSIAKYPTRFAGLAAVPTAAPKAAARELDRAVRELGLKGALINGHTRGRFLDDQFFWPIFEAAEGLEVPVYLHPGNPHPDVFAAYFKDYPALGFAAWGYAIDTGTHVFRLILSGVFDRFPKLKLIIGHMGELIPFALWRAGDRLTQAHPHLKRTVRDYVLNNIAMTTSGVFSTPELLCTAAVVGYDNILFAVDYPYESNLKAAEWLKGLAIDESDRQKIASGNAERILKL
jgi:predicted TIM-barrel fold metal-dependent hydrolase